MREHLSTCCGYYLVKRSATTAIAECQSCGMKTWGASADVAIARLELRRGLRLPTVTAVIAQQAPAKEAQR